MNLQSDTKKMLIDSICFERCFNCKNNYSCPTKKYYSRLKTPTKLDVSDFNRCISFGRKEISI